MPGNYSRSARYPELFRKSPRGPWWAFIPNPSGGRQLREPTGHHDEQAARAWYLDRVRRRAVDAAKDAATLYDALARRVSERSAAGRRADTLSFYRKKGKQLIRILGRDTLLSSISARVVDEYIARRLRGNGPDDPPVKATSVHKELVTLRGALKLARRQGFDCPDPSLVMPLDFSPKYKPKERALSEKEIDALLDALPPHRSSIVAFIISTGATYPSEVAPLRKGDIDMKRWMVRLRGTKRDTRDRMVPIVSFARRWLQQAVRGLPLARWSNVGRDMKKACAAAGIARCSPNDLRRSIATLMRARGVEPSLIGAYLGHKDSRMAERVYGRLPPEQLQHLLEQRLAATAKPGRRRTG